MTARGTFVLVCPAPPAILGADAFPIRSFFTPGAWRAWAETMRELLAALRRARQRGRRAWA